jgi:hypothetical protein
MAAAVVAATPAGGEEQLESGVEVYLAVSGGGEKGYRKVLVVGGEPEEGAIVVGGEDEGGGKGSNSCWIWITCLYC